MTGSVTAGESSSTPQKSISGHGHGHGKGRLGTLTGVFIPTCENMFGVLIFLRFNIIVGYGGVGHALLADLLSFVCAMCTSVCVSAIASSGGVVSKGGPYYMISRSLGPYVGATVGIFYYIGMIFLGALETSGAAEVLEMMFHQLSFSGVVNVLGTSIIALLSVCVWGGINIVSKLGAIFGLVVAFTIICYYISISAAPVTGVTSTYVSGLSQTFLSGNWGPQYPSGKSFSSILSIFFPCFTGILSGADRADVLRDPAKSIRIGTHAAIVFSFLMYGSYFVFWGAMADGCYLRADEACVPLTAGVESEESQVMRDILRPNFYVVATGVVISCISQILQCIIVAPRILQQISADHLIPALKYFEVTDANGEPKRALALTAFLALCFAQIGSVDTITPMVTLCFLVCYGFVCVAVPILTVLRTTTWRPDGIFQFRWRVWYIAAGVIGAVSSLIIAVLVSLYWTLGVMFVGILAYLYIMSNGEEAEWGSGLNGLRLHIALVSLAGLNREMGKRINWRPQVLVVYPPNSVPVLHGAGASGATSATGSLNERPPEAAFVTNMVNHSLLDFYMKLRKGQGMCMVAAVITPANLPKDVATNATATATANSNALTPTHSSPPAAVASSAATTATAAGVGLSTGSNPNINKPMESPAELLGTAASVELAKQVQALRKDYTEQIDKTLESRRILGFSEVVASTTWGDGANYLCQLAGIGGMRPNTLLLMWPTNWRKSPEFAVDFVRTINTGLNTDKAIVCLKDQGTMTSIGPNSGAFAELARQGLPASGFTARFSTAVANVLRTSTNRSDVTGSIIETGDDGNHQTIDMWWFINDGGLLMLITMLLSQHRAYRNCTVRVFVVLEGVDMNVASAVEERVRRLMKEKRILQNVIVEAVVLQDEMIEAYTYDWTIKLDKAKAAAAREKIAGLKGAMPAMEPSVLSMPGSIVRSATSLLTRSLSFNDGKKKEQDKPNELPKQFPTRVDQLFQIDEDHEEDCGPMSTVQSKMSSERSREGTSDLTSAGKSHHGPRSRALRMMKGLVDKIGHLTKTSTSHSAGSSSSASTSDQQLTPAASTEVRDHKYSDFGQLANAFAQAEHSGPNAVSAQKEQELLASVNKRYQKRRKELEKAPGSPTAAADHSHSGMTSSMHGGAANANENFKKLNHTILSKSAKSSLVLLNLPDVFGSSTDDCMAFMAYCECLTAGLQSVVFVHTLGGEIVNIF